MKSSAEKQIKESVRKLYELQQEKKKFDAYYKEVRNKEQLCISNFMFSNLEKSENSFEITLDSGVSYYKDNVGLKVTKVRTKKVVWVLEKLKEKLSKPKQKQVINKTYVIKDFNGLVKYLKTCGVDAKKFKKYIEVQENLNEEELNRLYEVGEISRKEVDGCYTIQMGEPYIKITEKKQEHETGL